MKRTPTRDLLEFIPFWVALKALGLLPASLAQAAGALLGQIAYLVLGRRRRIALANLERVLGVDLAPAARQRVARRSFRSLGRLIGVFAQFPRIDRKWVEERVRYQGWEHYREARAAGRGVLYLAAHFGAWEVIPMAQAALGEPMAFIVRPADNARIEGVIRSYRERLGNSAIVKQDALRECLRRLKRGETVGILIDQHVPPDRGVSTTFLGQATSTVGTLAALALKTGAPVLPVFAIAEPGGGHRIVFEPPVAPVRSGDREKDLEETTARYVAVVERYVREWPASWLWAHRRFRDGGPEKPVSAGGEAEPHSAPDRA